MSKDTVNMSFMILIKINKVRNFKGLLVPKNFACKNDAKFLRTPAFFQGYQALKLVQTKSEITEN